ncbi:MAG: tetratricopeptide repeat protein [Gemmataceae bacterium]|nr:tetratricopeptide repeat protein [Gemmataceae bacterium]
MIGDPLTVADMQDTLGRSLLGLGEAKLAVVVLEKAWATRQAQLGPDHPDTLTSMHNLAVGYQDAGQLDKALPLLEETLKLRKAQLGPDHPDTLTSMHNLASGYRATGQLDKALPLWEETLKLMKTKLGPDHPHTLASMNNLAVGYQAAGRLDKALPLWEETLKLMKAQLGPDHPDTLKSMNNLALGYWATGQLDKALPLYEEAAVSIEKRRFQHEHAQLIILDTIRAYEAAKQLDKAEVWRRKWLVVVKERAGDKSPAYAGELTALGLNLLRQNKWTEAESMLREALAIRTTKEPDAWTTFNTMSMLGGALLGQQKYAEAEPLLVKGYEGLKTRQKSIPKEGQMRIPEALERLVQLYEAVGKKEEAAKWRRELEATKKEIAP